VGKITDIKTQKKKTDRVNVFIDDQFAFGLSAALYFEKKLQVGKSISEKQTQDLIKGDQVERLLNKAFRFLSFRPRSEKETRDYLLRKGKLKEIKGEEEENQYERSVEEVISRLTKLKQLDDKAFASWWVDQRSKFRPRGQKLLRAELLSKGIAKGLIENLLDSQKEEQTQLAMNAAAKKIKTYKRLDDENLRIKLYQFLARRGFDWGVIKKAVDTLLEKR